MMVEIIGAALILFGGASLTASSATLVRSQRSAIDEARELLGDSDAAVPPALPADMTALLERIP